jgi:hypothetical protein
VLPSSYDDLTALVSAARKVRGRRVEFDWVFDLEELRRLRRAVYEWGRRVTGRYRGFDAAVLAAINGALDEHDSALALSFPPSAAFKGEVRCISENGQFHLRGTAPFDIVIGYGLAGVVQETAVALHLGEAVQRELASSVEMLGWDLRRLQEPRLKPVVNILYGNRPDYGVTEVSAPAGPITELAVHFQGPFSAIRSPSTRCVFEDEVGARSGIYLWTMNVGGVQRPWYIGQTRRGFGRRMAEHIRAMLAGEYTPYDAAALFNGEHKRASGAVTGLWPATLPAFLENYEQVSPHVIRYTRELRFHFAPLHGDRHLHDRIEGVVGRYLGSHADPGIRDFFFPGMRVPLAIPGDTPLRLEVTSESTIEGLPAVILA